MSAPKKFDPKSLDLAVGGQAVIEGVMMRCPTAIATAVRTPDGEIIVKKKPFTGVTQRWRFLNIPFVRGAINLVETMALGLSSLMFSAEQAMVDEDVTEKKSSTKDKLAMFATMGFAFVLSLGLFFYLPLILTDLTGVKSGFAFNLIDGVLRLVVFMGYLMLVSKLPDMQRVFQYHGAEHKTIHVFENRLPLVPKSARQFTTLHPRCGTSFLFFVMVVSILVFLTMGRPEDFVDRIQRLALVPVIGGIAYEVIKFSGRHSDKAWVQPFIWPGLMLQKITTNEPSDEQVEVAMAALSAVLDTEAVEYAELTYLDLAGASS